MTDVLITASELTELIKKEPCVDHRHAQSRRLCAPAICPTR